MLIFCFFVPKVCKSANNETKMFFGYFRNGFVYASKKLDFLMKLIEVISQLLMFLYHSEDTLRPCASWDGFFQVGNFHYY